MDNNLYPNNGEPYSPFKKLEEIRRKEIEEVLEEIPLIKEIYEHLTARIEFYKQISSIPPEVRADPEKFMVSVNANDTTTQNLQAELDWLKEKLEPLR